MTQWSCSLLLFLFFRGFMKKLKRAGYTEVLHCIPYIQHVEEYGYIFQDRLVIWTSIKRRMHGNSLNYLFEQTLDAG